MTSIPDWIMDKLKVSTPRKISIIRKHNRLFKSFQEHPLSYLKSSRNSLSPEQKNSTSNYYQNSIFIPVNQETPKKSIIIHKYKPSIERILNATSKLEIITRKNIENEDFKDDIKSRISLKAKLNHLNKSELRIVGEKAGVSLPKIYQFHRNPGKMKNKNVNDQSTVFCDRKFEEAETDFRMLSDIDCDKD
ncbi:unnamed protein product [Blepharisma stoltei]|uniref:Uncharacterized protein n=1 Tax=Blepharisma stoltei TaxID=1481888 RepID=A0AAU9IV80_9CILI|nr:unnamed protein product [Blepharisma stoltei]